MRLCAARSATQQRFSVFSGCVSPNKHPTTGSKLLKILDPQLGYAPRRPEPIARILRRAQGAESAGLWGEHGANIVRFRPSHTQVHLGETPGKFRPSRHATDRHPFSRHGDVRIATGARSQSPHLPHVPNHNGMLVRSICVAADASRVRTTHTMTCPFCHGSAETMAMADDQASVSSLSQSTILTSHQRRGFDYHA